MQHTDLSTDHRRLVEANLALVEHIVNRLVGHLPKKLGRDDLVQVGRLGLVEAAQRFDDSRGIAFSTFAGRRIEGSIRDAIRREDWMPRASRTRAAELARLEDELQATTGIVPSHEELAQAAGIETGEIEQIREAVRRSSVQSINRPYGSEDGEAATLEDFMSGPGQDEPGNDLERRELLVMLRTGIQLLPERQRIVTIAYFLEGKPMDQIADLLGVTQSRISQIKDDAVRMLRAGLEAQFEEVRQVATSLSERRRAEFADAIASTVPRPYALDETVIDLRLDLLDITDHPTSVL